MNHLKKSLTLFSLLTLTALGQSADAFDADDLGGDNQTKQSARSNDKSSSGLSSGRTDELTLVDLRDSGIALNQVRQEAINIFLEATRTPCDKTTKGELLIPTSITEKELELAIKVNDYQPPRPQWLVYYVGTMEPIISMLCQDVHDAESGISKMLVPAGTLDKLKPLWYEWKTGIGGINKELTEISNLIDSTKPDNVELAKHAAALYNFTVNLEHTREKAFVVIRDAPKHGSPAEKVSLPGQPEGK